MYFPDSILIFQPRKWVSHSCKCIIISMLEWNYILFGDPEKYVINMDWFVIEIWQISVDIFICKNQSEQRVHHNRFKFSSIITVLPSKRLWCFNLCRWNWISDWMDPKNPGNSSYSRLCGLLSNSRVDS